MEEKTTKGSNESRKVNKVEVGVVHESPEELEAKFLKAGIGDFKIVASFWSTTLQNMKTFVSEAKKKVSSYLDFDNGKVIPSEAFQLHINSVILKLHSNKEKGKSVNKKENTGKQEKSAKRTPEKSPNTQNKENRATTERGED